MQTSTNIKRTRTLGLSFLPLTLLVALVAALLLVFAAAAQAAVVNKIEPNDSIDQAQNIDSSFDLSANTEIGRLVPTAPTGQEWVDTSQTIPHATINVPTDPLSTGGSVDFYSFTVPAEASTTQFVGMFDTDHVSPTGYWGLDTTIKLYDATGQQLASNDDTTPTDPGSVSRYNLNFSADSYLQYAFPGPGLYYVSVGDYPNGTGPISNYWESYQLHVSVGPMGTDTTPPLLVLPSDTIWEAESAAGANVSFYPEPAARDDWYGSVPVKCTPAPGSTFPLGTTTVNCEAADGAGNQATGSFAVTVEDTRAPYITLPPQVDPEEGEISVEATGPQGARVTWGEATANDLVDGKVAVTSDHASGSRFPVGETVVTFTATDSHGNTASRTMSVIVFVRDTEAPTVKVSADGAPRVPTTANVRATFSEPVANVFETSFYLRQVISTGKKTPPTYVPVPASVTQSEDGKTAVLDPTNDLTKGGTYEAGFTSGVTDFWGNPLVVPKPYTFTVTR
jgi:hypothetical protein